MVVTELGWIKGWHASIAFNAMESSGKYTCKFMAVCSDPSEYMCISCDISKRLGKGVKFFINTLHPKGWRAGRAENMNYPIGRCADLRS